MKVVCVSMSKQEQVLDSYLLRVFGGHLVEKGTVKTVRFPEDNLKAKPVWNTQMFKNFCFHCVSDKKSLRMYKARLIPQEGGQHAE